VKLGHFAEQETSSFFLFFFPSYFSTDPAAVSSSTYAGCLASLKISMLCSYAEETSEQGKQTLLDYNEDSGSFQYKLP